MIQAFFMRQSKATTVSNKPITRSSASRRRFRHGQTFQNAAKFVTLCPARPLKRRRAGTADGMTSQQIRDGVERTGGRLLAVQGDNAVAPAQNPQWVERDISMAAPAPATVEQN